MKECLKVDVSSWSSSSTVVLSQSQVRPGSALTTHLGEPRAVLHPWQVSTTLGAPAAGVPSSTLGGPADSRGSSSCLKHIESAWDSLDPIKLDAEPQKTWADYPRNGKAREKKKRNILKFPVTPEKNLSFWKKSCDPSLCAKKDITQKTMNYWKCSWRMGRENRLLAREHFIFLLQWVSFLSFPCVDAMLFFPFHFDTREADSPYKVTSTWIMQKIWSYFTMKQYKLSKTPLMQRRDMEVSQYLVFIYFFFSTKTYLTWRSHNRPAPFFSSFFFSFKSPVSAPISNLTPAFHLIWAKNRSSGGSLWRFLQEWGSSVNTGE